MTATKYSVSLATLVARFLVALVLVALVAETASAQTCPMDKPSRRYKVKIESAPAGAVVYLDRKECGPVGVTPWQGSMASGDYKVILELDGYNLGEKQIKIARKSALQSFFHPLDKRIDPPKLDIRADSDQNVFGAAISVDGQVQGTVPAIVITTPGRHLVEIRKDGYEPFTSWVEAYENKTVLVTPVLRAVQAKVGTIIVEADVLDAEVFINGTKNPDNTPTIVAGVIEGVHVVEVRKGSGPPWKQSVQVIAGQQAKVRAQLASTLSGTISVQSNISGAQVFVDGKEAGRAPVNVSVPAGDHLVSVRADGYTAAEETVKVANNSTATIKLDLSPAIGGPIGTLSVVSPVPGAEVFVDGARLGTVPQEQQIASGEHYVVVKLAGYKSFEAKVLVEGGKVTQVSAELKASGKLRVLSSPSGAQVTINGLVKGTTPVDIDVEAGANIISVVAPGRTSYECSVVVTDPANPAPAGGGGCLVTVASGGDAMINAELPIAKLSLEEQEVERRSRSSWGARTLEKGSAMADISVGYPYYLYGRATFGFGKLGPVGFDAALLYKTNLARGNLGIGARALIYDRSPIAVGAFTEFSGGGSRLDQSGRSGIDWNLGGTVSLTAINAITISARLYLNVYGDKHCSETENGQFVAESPIDACVGYQKRLNGENPADFTLADQLRLEELTGMAGNEMFGGRDWGGRFMGSLIAEAAVQERWSLFVVLDSALAQKERAFYTNLVSKSMLEKDYGIYVQAGASFKF